MDFDFYTIQIEIKDEVQNVTTSIKTSEVSYMGIFDVSELADNYLTARVQVNAVNRCSNSSLYSDPLNINQGMTLNINHKYYYTMSI